MDPAVRSWNIPVIPPALVKSGGMARTHLFFKVEVEHDEDEDPDKIGEEISRQLRRLYVVRSVELSSVVTAPD